jgi:chromosome segregation ATPase
MKLSFVIPFTSMLLLFPLASHSQGSTGTQQSQNQPAVINPAPAVEQIAANPSPQSPDQQRQAMNDHYRTCHQTLEQARTQAHKLSSGANGQGFNIDALDQQHKELLEQFRTLKANREQFLSDLSEEQQKSIQVHNQSMQQIHDRIQAHLETIQQEFTGSNLHLVVVANEAKAAEREMKSYHKHLQETGRAFNLLSD